MTPSSGRPATSGNAVLAQSETDIPLVRRAVRVSQQVAVGLCVLAAGTLGTVGWMYGLGFYDDRADQHAALTREDLVYGFRPGSPNIIRDRGPVEYALAVMPEDATFEVVTGPSWRPSWRTHLSDHLEADFLALHLFPRRLVDEGGDWIFCFACEPSVERQMRTLSREGELLFGARER